MFVIITNFIKRLRPIYTRSYRLCMQEALSPTGLIPVAAFSLGATLQAQSSALFHIVRKLPSIGI